MKLEGKNKTINVSGIGLVFAAIILDNVVANVCRTIVTKNTIKKKES